MLYNRNKSLKQITDLLQLEDKAKLFPKKTEIIRDLVHAYAVALTSAWSKSTTTSRTRSRFTSTRR